MRCGSRSAQSRCQFTPILRGAVALSLYVLHCLGRSWLGRAFDTIRQDETISVSLAATTSAVSPRCPMPLLSLEDAERRVELVRAFATRPLLLLLDKPVAGVKEVEA